MSLADRLALTDLVHRYAALVDDRQFEKAAALFADWLAPYDYRAQSLLKRLKPPAFLGGPKEIYPLHLSRQEKKDLVSFLESLTGDPVPAALVADTHRP